MPEIHVILFTMFGENIGKYLSSAIGIDAVLSKPDGVTQLVISGMARSRRTKSGFSVIAFCTASRPLTASPQTTTSVRVDRYRFRISRTTMLSSAISTCLWVSGRTT
jgi:hypothetical protein